MEDQKYYAPRGTKIVTNGCNHSHEYFEYRESGDNTFPRASSRKDAIALGNIAKKIIIPEFKENF